MAIVPKIAAFLKDHSSPKVFKTAKSVYQAVAVPSKTTGEMDFWRMQYHREGGKLSNAHFEKVMRNMAIPLNLSDFEGKLVCDFGCGPRGSLSWLKDTAHCVGIDVLADKYFEAFPYVIRANEMTYVNCSEDYIPMQSQQADVVFTMNALDHVIHLEVMCDELVRILKPGGYFIGSFNLGEERTVTEPQSFDLDILNSVLFRYFDEISKRSAPKFEDDTYAGFFGREAPVDYNGPEVLWFVGRKPEGSSSVRNRRRRS